MSAKFSDTGGQGEEEDIGHPTLLQFGTLWTHSNSTITVFDWHNTFATEKVRKGGPHTQTRHYLVLSSYRKKKEATTKTIKHQGKSSEWHILLLASNDFHMHKNILHLCMEFKDSFLILYAVTQNTLHKKQGKKGEKVQQEQNRAKEEQREK